MKTTLDARLGFANKRLFRASVFLCLCFFLLFMRIWHLQVYRGSYYAQISENNRVRKVDIAPPRGLIYDRHGEVILANKRMYDLVYIPQYVQDEKKTLELLSSLLHSSVSSLEKALRRHRGAPRFMPIVLKQNLTTHERSLIESYKVKLPGVLIKNIPKRDYTKNLPVHLLGYLSEHRTVGKSASDSYRYLPGDLSGKQGLERVWEKYLRGQRGFRYIQVDALGREVRSQSPFSPYSFPEVKAKSGLNLHLTLDKKLQKATQEAFRGKNGAVVVLDPRSGQVLSLLSSPSYDPKVFQEGLSHERWQALLDEPFKPLFDKTTGGLFSPGSLFKPLIGLAAMEEGLISDLSQYHCPGKLELGSRVFHCHNRWGHGLVDLRNAMLKSCDVFFYHLGLDLGIDQIERYSKDFYLGNKLGLNINKEYEGLVPSSQWKREKYQASVTAGDLANLSIGQGALLMTPLQMASFFSTLANLGYVWRPYLVSHLSNREGDIIKKNGPKLLHEVQLVKKINFKKMKKILFDSVETKGSTGHRARIEGQKIAGKTGSVQVVSLKKNRNRHSVVSMKWQEHAMFAGFSPIEKPEIVVLVLSENDPEGGGGAQSAPIARAIFDAYWKLKAERSTSQSPLSST